MRNLLIAGAILLSFPCFAQQSTANNGQQGKIVKKESDQGHSGAYFNLSTGVNNNGGIIGLGVELPIITQAAIEVGVGEGTWGYKMYACGKVYLRPDLKGWAFGPGITYSTGVNELDVNLETVAGTTEKVTMHLNPQTNVFIAAYRNWRLGKNYNRIYLQLGWSVALADPDFYQVAGTPISQNGVNVTKFISPGGLIVAVGFSFGGKKRDRVILSE